MMPVGDSITHGWQGANVNAAGNGYRLQLWNDITDNTKHFVGSQISGDLPDPYNEGYNGAIISDIESYISNSLTSMRPNIVLIHAGTNDMGRPYEPDTAPDRLGNLIDEVISVCPDAVVLVAQIITIADSASNERRETYNAAIPGVVASRSNAGKHVAVVDMSNLLTTSDLIDGLHPTDDGYAKMGDAWFAAIQSAGTQGWITAPVSTGSENPCSSLAWNPVNQIASGSGNANIVFADLDGKTSFFRGSLNIVLIRDTDR